MVQIQLRDDGVTVEIRINLWYLAQIIDADNWLRVIIRECEKILVDHIDNLEKPDNV